MLKTPITPLQFHLQITEQEEQVLKLLAKSPMLTGAEICHQLGIKSPTTLSRQMNQMKRAGIVKRDFNDQYAKWFLNPHNQSAISLITEAAGA